MNRVVQLFLFSTVFMTGCGSNPGVVQTVSRDFSLNASDSIGVELGDTSYVFGVFTHCRDSQGDILVLDITSRSVRRFTEQGEHVLSLSLEGGGPGQFNMPRNIAPLPGGGFLVSSAADRKLCVYSSQMELAGEIVNSSGSIMGPMKSIALTDTTFVSRFYSFSEDTVTGFICTQSVTDEEEFTVLKEKAVVSPDGDEWHDAASILFAASPDGTVFAAEYSCDTWIIEHLNADGTVINVLERKYPPEPFTEEEALHAAETYRRRYVHAFNTDAGFEYTPPDFRYSIESLQVDGNGNLWVESGTAATSEYRIYSPEGEFLFRCSFVGPDWQMCDGWQLTIDSTGFLASPENPEMYPLVYVLQIQSVQ